jgi:uncharacterized membrane protein YdbT with pleckstrin-like domain
VSDLTIRPTLKFIQAGAILAALVVVGLWIACWAYGAPQWVAYITPAVLLWPAMRWLRRQFTKAVISGDRLRYATGVASRSTRNIQLSKLQDVRVDQRLAQRLWNVGDLSIETAGETSRLTIANVDGPQALADEIMNRAQKGTTSM